MHFIQTVGYTLLECKGYEEITRELEIPQMTGSREQRRNLKVQVHRITNRIFKYVPKGNSCFVMSIIGLSGSNTRKDDYDLMNCLQEILFLGVFFLTVQIIQCWLSRRFWTTNCKLWTKWSWPILRYYKFRSLMKYTFVHIRQIMLFKKRLFHYCWELGVFSFTLHSWVTDLYLPHIQWFIITQHFKSRHETARCTTMTLSQFGLFLKMKYTMCIKIF